MSMRVSRAICHDPRRHEEGKLPVRGTALSGMALTSRIKPHVCSGRFDVQNVDTDAVVTTTTAASVPVDTAVGPDGPSMFADWATSGWITRTRATHGTSRVDGSGVCGGRTTARRLHSTSLNGAARSSWSCSGTRESGTATRHDDCSASVKTSRSFPGCADLLENGADSSHSRRSGRRTSSREWTPSGRLPCWITRMRPFGPGHCAS